MAILFGIDGTGATKDGEYNSDTADSFVRRLCGAHGTVQNRKYERGPTTVGFKMLHAIGAGVDFITQQRNGGNSEPIIMVGHSRGAAGVVVVAKRLQEQNINVHALMLFDCVDRHMFIDASRIPNNVANVLHARRDRQARSRESFGNDGTRSSAPTIYEERFFVATHGCLGGTYWKPKPEKDEKLSDIINEGFPDGKTTITFQEDARMSGVIWANVQPFLRVNGYIQ